MTWMRWLSSGLLLTVAACGDDEKQPVGPGPDTTNDTSNGDTGSWSGGDVADTSDTSNGNFTPNPACDPNEIDYVNWGTSIPWAGLSAGGQNYTCNKCPKGAGVLQGTWRAHGFDEDGNPDYSKGADAENDDADLLIIDGNTFQERLWDVQTGNESIFSGWYFCSQKPEHPNEHLFWKITQSNKQMSDIYRTDIPLGQGNDQRLIIYYDNLDGGANVQIGYCRVGTTYQGQHCNNPFE